MANVAKAKAEDSGGRAAHLAIACCHLLDAADHTVEHRRHLLGIHCDLRTAASLVLIGQNAVGLTYGSREMQCLQ